MPAAPPRIAFGDLCEQGTGQRVNATPMPMPQSIAGARKQLPPDAKATPVEGAVAGHWLFVAAEELYGDGASRGGVGAAMRSEERDHYREQLLWCLLGDPVPAPRNDGTLHIIGRELHAVRWRFTSTFLRADG